MTGQPNPGAPRRKRRWPRRVLVVFLILGCLYTAYRYTLHRMVEAKLDEIRKQGYPVTLAELDKWYPQVPARENATDMYLEALRMEMNGQAAQTQTLTHEQLVKEIQRRVAEPRPKSKMDLVPVVGFAKLPTRSDPFTADMKEASKGFLVEKKEVLDVLHRAAAFSSVRYHLRASDPFEVLRCCNGIRTLCRLLYLETITLAEDSDFNHASQSAICSLKIAKSLNDEPVLIAHLVRIACERMAVESLERVVSRGAIEEHSLEALGVAATNTMKSRSVARALALERVTGIHQFFHPSETQQIYIQYAKPGLGGRFLLRLMLSLYRESGALDADLLGYLKRMDACIRVAQLPLAERSQAAMGIEQRVVDSFWYQFVFRATTLSGVGSIIGKDLSVSAHEYDAIVALALERYRLKNNRLPDALTELAPAYLPAVPTDPFTGQPLRYKRPAKGYVVYSVGEDGKDDGGDEKKDITFTVER